MAGKPCVQALPAGSQLLKHQPGERGKTAPVPRCPVTRAPNYATPVYAVGNATPCPACLPSADEHYFPTLLAALGLENETYCSGMGLAATDWAIGGYHPKTWRWVGQGRAIECQDVTNAHHIPRLIAQCPAGPAPSSKGLSGACSGKPSPHARPPARPPTIQTAVSCGTYVAVCVCAGLRI